uniref:hypothetical protein n=1 Tax=Paraisaria heteropoda TaxID=2651841 RepID=UPI0026E1C4DA|nr:hypothetical protein Q6C72_mgp01 [Paraisaria heteropoda]WJR82532.1 hypothetical protein [Paraisaria heteropoda]
MDYRGSKSAIRNSITVKEQRVDGSWYIKNNLMCLRCTLINFERNSQVKILSMQISNIRKYTSITTHKPLTITKLQSSLNPWFLTGFSFFFYIHKKTAEGSFSILIQTNNKYATGWRIKPIFTIGLHKKDLDLLNKIQSYLGIGKIHIHGKDSIQFRVDSLKDLQILLNHFENFPLVTAKLADYILFKKAFDIILLKEHLSQEGLLKLVGIKASLNLGLNQNIKKAFSNWEELQVNRPNYTFKSIPDSNWMAGFASGDSSFNIKTSKSTTSALGQRVQLRFAIELNIREKDFVEHLPAYFKLRDPLKNVYIDNKVARFQIVNYFDITDKILPFFEKYLIQGKKSLDFISFKEVALIIKNKDHLNLEGFKEILDIKDRMNK